MNFPYVLTCIALMAVVTYLLRMLPLVLVKGQIQNPFVRSFLYYVPYAVLSAMTFPAVFSSTSSPVSAAAGFAAAVILSFFRRGLLTVALSAAAVVYLTEWIMHLF